MQLDNKKYEYYKKILQEFGPSGYEKRIIKLMREYYSQYTDEIIQDNLGSCFAVMRNKAGKKDAKKVLVMAHGDEVGFMVSQITEKGFLKVVPLGGMWEQTLLSNRVLLLNSNNEFLHGTFSAISPHLLSADLASKPFPIEKMLVDLGFRSKQEALQAGVSQGNFLICIGETQLLGNDRLLSKAVDNRMGVILGLEVLSEIKNLQIDYDIYVGFSTQEEVGSRGARTAVALIKPDLAIVTDVSPGQDYYASDTFGQLGEGVMLRGMDRGYITRYDLMDYQRQILDKNKIKYQFYISPGSTDASAVHLYEAGVPTIQACLIARNLHTTSGIIDINDFYETKKFVLAILQDLSCKKIEQFEFLNSKGK